MALSPAQRHSQRIAMEQKLKRSQALETTESMHMLIRALETDVEHVRSLPTIADRVEYKRDVLLPRWVPTVEAYLESGQVYANPVFAWCVIWLFDVGDLDKALDWADIAISQQQATPDRLRSNFPTFVADTLLEWTQETAGRGESVEPYFTRTFERVANTWRLHEQVTAKWFKFAGLELLRNDDGQKTAAGVDDIETLEKADQLLAIAEKHYSKIGVRTARQTIAARIRKLTTQG
ncbi:terminase [Escherichia coli]|nr:terminase [Escherichia coli]MED8479622.1 phage terminase small subunit [Escherichia coli]MED8493730.1 phage terminase small subunit [Escherichia coli]MED9020464.1 phage terminase small subunit [Escherichia coli]HAO7389802.1 terminase [Escherichia coli]